MSMPRYDAERFVLRRAPRAPVGVMIVAARSLTRWARAAQGLRPDAGARYVISMGSCAMARYNHYSLRGRARSATASCQSTSTCQAAADPERLLIWRASAAKKIRRTGTIER